MQSGLFASPLAIMVLNGMKYVLMLFQEPSSFVFFIEYAPPGHTQLLLEQIVNGTDKVKKGVVLGGLGNSIMKFEVSPGAQSVFLKILFHFTQDSFKPFDMLRGGSFSRQGGGSDFQMFPEFK
jgi:hypothetical protein